MGWLKYWKSGGLELGLGVRGKTHSVSEDALCEVSLLQLHFTFSIHRLLLVIVNSKIRQNRTQKGIPAFDTFSRHVHLKSWFWSSDVSVVSINSWGKCLLHYVQQLVAKIVCCLVLSRKQSVYRISFFHSNWEWDQSLETKTLSN